MSAIDAHPTPQQRADINLDLSLGNAPLVSGYKHNRNLKLL